MDAMRPVQDVTDPRLGLNSTPLNLPAWAEHLRQHPDRAFVQYLLQGISHGFRIGYDWAAPRLSASRNMASADEHPAVIQAYIDEERELGRIMGPFSPGDLQPEVHISRFGIIPKKHQKGKWRMIVDLSHPQGRSINDGISSELCSLSYTKLDEIVESIWKLGPGTQLAKIDIKNAYRIIPVHPSDRHLLAMEWKGLIYVDTVLPFGLRSAPKIFNSVADALEFILKRCGVKEVKHYLDDFLTIGAPNSSECARNMQLMQLICKQLGVPLAIHKSEGPYFCLVYIGFELDTVNMIVRLPAEKLARYESLISEWVQKKSCTKHELDSLIGQLHHAAAVVKPGRSFLRRMIVLSKVATKPWHHLRLNASFHSDLLWWKLFLRAWNGATMMSVIAKQTTDAEIVSDASGKWGCGAYSGDQWLQLQWKSGNQAHLQSIAAKEMVPLVVAVAIWGKAWRGYQVLCRCDNQAVVSIINTRYSRDITLMHMLRCLFFIEASFGLSVRAVHIAGSANVLADSLSRNNAAFFLSKVPSASAIPSTVPPELLDLLLYSQPDWTSLSWTAMFSTYLGRV